MRPELVEKATQIIPDPQILVNIISQRVAQLNSGNSPLVPTTPHMGSANIALQEIIQGKIKYEQADAE